ncbi:hypothetical protein ADICYQ_1259 [Cyclobacterium qasimii M12-11B]|uniref:Uncharacterized protein n=2 Tax=Cyclobacterium qasimii TaxID=1350429 RepID=S7X107_9BACT|nr:hypothetical protein ADICYQ_1259 [Cyclobacterium qasimii M12-11B]GEO24145.1 hypothetical protein CQA01_46790 [Cyclobacterium qasimii]
MVSGKEINSLLVHASKSKEVKNDNYQNKAKSFLRRRIIISPMEKAKESHTDQGRA